MTHPKAANTSTKLLFLQWFVHLAVIVLLAGEAVPGINESHYLPKAKSALDATFAPGDLFLESNNSHFASTYLAGAFTTFLPLTAVAWVGRILAWGLLSYAWLRFKSAARIPPLLSPFALASWYLATEYGHWAGEWAVGGFEGKSLAYPCVLCALACMLQCRFSGAWLWLGWAVLWHPLVGGWAGITVALVWVCVSWRNPWTALLTQLPYLLTAALISAVGILPALGGIGGSEQFGNIVASQVHVYFRLSHHLCPLAFDTERHWAAAITVGTFLLVNVMWFLFRSSSQSSEPSQAKSKQDSGYEIGEDPDRSVLGRLLLVAWFAVGIAGIGLFVDMQMSVPESSFYNPLVASKILRFYWFRWADIVVPLASTAMLWHMLGVWGDDVARNGKSQPSWVGRLTLSMAMVVVLGIGVRRIWNGWDDTLPPADRMLVENMGQRRKVEWPEEDSNRHRDWMAVCDWIRKETPNDALWLTPRYQQSFKWYANRAEVVCWKDVPQDNASVLEWFTRIQILEPKRDARGRIRFWTDKELAELRNEFGFDYVLADRTYIAPGEIPMQEIVYPIAPIENRTFAVFRMREP